MQLLNVLNDVNKTPREQYGSKRLRFHGVRERDSQLGTNYSRPAFWYIHALYCFLKILIIHYISYSFLILLLMF